ncbi:MAG: TolC family protein [Vicinamibacterales bacterium]
MRIPGFRVPGLAPALRPVLTVLFCLVLIPAAPAAGQQMPFTLGDALARARDTSPEGAAADARVEAAQRALDVSGRLLNPVAEFRWENWGSLAPAPGLPPDVFATLTQTVELGGKRALRRDTAAAGLGIARAGASVARSLLALDITRAYMEALRARERQGLLATRADELGELVRVLASRVAAGTTAEADLLKMRTEQARAGADVVRARLAATRALATLTARLDVDTTLDALARPAVPLPASTDVREALERRADVVAAGQAIDSARLAVRVEDARRIPDVAVNAGLKRTAGFNSGVVAVTMPIPVFERNRSARILAQGQLLAAERDRDAVARRAMADITATRMAATELASRAREVQTTLVEPARGALDAARSAFASGALDVLRVLDAERVYTDAMLIALDLDIDAAVSAIEARLAAGEAPLP